MSDLVAVVRDPLPVPNRYTICTQCKRKIPGGKVNLKKHKQDEHSYGPD